jgi:hypothetical protein
MPIVGARQMKSKFRMSRVLAAMTLLAGSPGRAYASSPGAPAPVDRARARSRSIGLPVFFEKNRGQTDVSVEFFARTAGYSLYLTATQAVMVLPPAAGKKDGVAVRMTLRGANTRPSVRGRDLLPGHTSYMIGGDRSKWRTGVEQFGKVEFGQVYPGIDVVYYGKQGRVEHDFVVAPGADPRNIVMDFEGGKNLRLDDRGALLLGVEGGEVVYQAPTLYQMIGGKKTQVNGRFSLAGRHRVRFEVGDYDGSKELVIDPALGYSSYLGGAGNDYGNAIAVDALGNAYVTGSTNSNPFPGLAGEYQSTYGAGAASNVFVTKINPAGTAILWSTYIGGTGQDVGNAIAVDASGKVYITGSTTDSASFPHTASFGTGLAGTDAFVAAFNADGKSVVYSDVFGGPGTDAGNGIAVTAAGVAYVTGSTDGTFPVTAGAAQTALGGMSDAFVAEFTAAGAKAYATYLGGANQDFGNAIAIDGSGNAYVTGQCGDTFVAVASYANVFMNTVPGASSAFIAVLNVAQSTFTYKTYIGGAGTGAGTGIALDGSNSVYITGWTGGSGFPNGDGSFGGLVGQTTPGGGPSDAFVFKLNPSGHGLGDGVYATYLGGGGIDHANAIAVDSGGDAYVAGFTTSPDFPVTGGTPAFIGTPEAFVTEIGPTGAARVFSSYLGGDTITYGQGLALDGLNNIYVTGNTNTSDGTFPTAGPFQASSGGSYDAFVSKFGSSIPPQPLPVCTINPLVPSSGTSLGGTLVTAVGTGFIGVSASSDVAFGAANAASYTVVYSTEITATTPSHAPGSVSFTVTTTSGTCAEPFNFVDVTSPTIAIVAPPNGSFFNGASTIAVIDYADGGGPGLNLSSVVVMLNGTPVLAGAISVYASSATASLSGLTQRAYTLDASISDNSGNLTNAAQTGFTVDLASPTIAVVAPINGSYLNGTSTVAVINYADAGGSGLNLTSLVVKLNGTAIAASSITAYSSSATVALAGLTQRAYTLDASIMDAAGNLTNAAQTGFTVSLGLPAIAIVQPPNGSYLNSASTTAVIDYSDPGGPGLNLASLIVKLNGTPVASGAIAVFPSSAAVLLSGLTQRAYTLDASIQDIAAGLNNAVETGFTVDLTSPTIAVAFPLNGGFLNSASTAATINYADAGGSGLNLASLSVRIDGSSIAAAAGASQATANLAGLAQGVHVLSAAIVDNAGNAAATASSFTVNLVAPAAACTITSLAGSGSASGGNMVTVTGTGFIGVSASSDVVFGSVDATAYAVNAASTVITAMAPSNPAGTVLLSVTTSSGTCTENYTYLAVPAAAVACGPDIFYPSPATGAVGTFAYCMDFAGTALIRVYNSIGDLVAKVQDVKTSGAQLSTLNTTRLSPGVYLYLLEKEYGAGNTAHAPVRKFVVKH